MSNDLQASVSRPLRENRVGRVLSGKGHRWRVVLIEEGLSANGPYYKKSAVERIATLGEGQRCYVTEVVGQFDHLNLKLRKPDQQPLKNECAFFENARVEKIDGRYCATADFVILSDAKWLAERLSDLHSRGKLDNIGFSIVATGICQRVDGRDVVNDIKQLDSVDLVHDPAAGGRILDLVAQRNHKQKKGSTLMKETLASLLGCFKGLDLFESLRESNLAELSEQDAVDVLKAMAEEAENADEKSEQGKVEEMLKAILKMAEAGKTDDLKKFVAGLLSGKYPEPSADSQAAQTEAAGTLSKVRALLGLEAKGDLSEAISKLQEEAKLAEQQLSEKKGEVTQLIERVTVLEKDKAKAEAEDFVQRELIEKRKVILPKNKASWVEAYLANKELVEAQAKDMCSIAELNPESGHDGEGPDTEIESVEKANEELQKIMKEQKCDLRTAANILQRRQLKQAKEGA